MSNPVDFNRDRLDSEGQIIPSDSEVLSVLKKKSGAMTVARLTRVISLKKGETVKKVHISNTLLRLHYARKVNKYISRGKPNEWRYGWGVIVFMDKDGYKENVSIKPDLPKPKSVQYKPIQQNPIKEKKKMKEIHYATDSERIDFVRFLGYKTLDEAIRELGSWKFEAQLKAHLK